MTKILSLAIMTIFLTPFANFPRKSCEKKKKQYLPISVLGSADNGKERRNGGKWLINEVATFMNDTFSRRETTSTDNLFPYACPSDMNFAERLQLPREILFFWSSAIPEL